MKRVLTIFALAFAALQATAQTDTLRVMTYNVLYYGSGCQGPNDKYHGYFKKIIGFTNPDLLGIVKTASPKLTPNDPNGTAPYGFADSILNYAMNAAFPGRYAFCPFTNEAHTNNTCILFYDTRKLGFVSMVCSYVNITDFNTWKLYYKDPALEKTRDTTFLYVTLNHDKSGDEFEQVRANQITGCMAEVRKHFSQMPNYINMGDYNLRGADEPCYQHLTQHADSGFRVYDPPFFPDRKLKYPAHWDHEPMYSAFFTTSTRESTVVPNPCGTGGGGKNWYDHIFLSHWLLDGRNYIRYLPYSYRTIGNDGQRFRVSIMNKNAHENTSAPSDVIEALYQMSNKYPVMVDLLVTSNTSGNSPVDPEQPVPYSLSKEEVSVDSLIQDELVVHFPASFQAQEVTIIVTDSKGEEVLNKKFTIKRTESSFRIRQEPGIYTVTIRGKHNLILQTKAEKK